MRGVLFWVERSTAREAREMFGISVSFHAIPARILNILRKITDVATITAKLTSFHVEKVFSKF